MEGNTPVSSSFSGDEAFAWTRVVILMTNISSTPQQAIFKLNKYFLNFEENPPPQKKFRFLTQTRHGKDAAVSVRNKTEIATSSFWEKSKWGQVYTGTKVPSSAVVKKKVQPGMLSASRDQVETIFGNVENIKGLDTMFFYFSPNINDNQAESVVID